MMRVARAVASALTLAALTVGVFFALLTFGRLPGWDELADLPGEMLTDTTAFALLTVLAWAAWAVFTGTVAVELVGELTGNRRWRLPSGTPFQATARRLVAAITISATLSGPLLARSGPAPTLAAAAAAETAGVVDTPLPVRTPVVVTPPISNQPSIDRLVTTVAPGSPPAAPQPPAAADQLPAVTVAVGDTPWGIAERHLGRGIRWREIWNLNRGVPQPDGRAWVTEDLIHPGWRLLLPADAVGVNPPAAPTIPAPDGSDAPDQPAQTDAPAPAPPDADDSAPGHDTAPADSGHDEAQPSTDPAACDPERLPRDSDDSASTTPEAPPPDSQTARPDTPGTDGSDGSDGSDGAIDHEDETDDAILGLAVLAGITGATVTATGLAFQIRRRRRRRTAKTATAAWGPDDPDDVSTEQAVAAASDLPLVQTIPPAASTAGHKQ